MINILVTLHLEERHKVVLESIAPQGKFIYRQASRLSEEEVQVADIILGYIDPALLKYCPHLKWLQLPTAGSDQHAVALQNTAAVLTNATGAYGLAISEHMMATTLCLMKKMHLYLANQQKVLWKDEGAVTSLFGATVLVVGLGDIGSEFAKRVKAMGSYVIGIRRVLRDRPEFVDEIADMGELDTMLTRADVVALCLPASGETIQLFNRERLLRMKQGAILLNVGRGSAVDQVALCEVLESGQLGGAGIDVTEPEPLPADNRLWQAPNLLLTPHVSGGYHLPETVERIFNICAMNLRAYIAGETLRNLVDFDTGYRRTPEK